MSGFDASTVIEPLSWRFGDGVEGITSEPSERQIVAFTRGYIELAGFRLGETLEERTERLKDEPPLDAAQETEHLEKYRKLVDDLCAGCPTREQIDALGFRILREFAGWLWSQIQDPQKPTTVTTTSTVAG